MAFGSITQSYERDTAVDFSYPYDSTATGIVSKKPGHITSKLALFRPFQPPVWVAIAITLVSFVPTYWVSNYNIRHSNTKVSLNKALFLSIQSMLLQSNYKHLFLYEYWIWGCVNSPPYAVRSEAVRMGDHSSYSKVFISWSQELLEVIIPIPNVYVRSTIKCSFQV